MLRPFDDCISDAGVVVPVTRYLAPVVEHGRIVSEATDEEFEICASIQPIKPRELMLLPEGMRNEAAMVAYTTCRLYTVRTSDSKRPDRLTYRGVEYQVHSVEDWYDLGGYYKCVIVRIDR